MKKTDPAPARGLRGSRQFGISPECFRFAFELLVAVYLVVVILVGARRRPG